MGSLFGLSQPQVCAWVGRLLPLLQEFRRCICPPGTGEPSRRSWRAYPKLRRSCSTAPSGRSAGRSISGDGTRTTVDDADARRSRMSWSLPGVGSYC
jgi:hypothetical protein